jgi:hypothetical protein
MGRFQAIGVDVGIDLGGGDVGMTEHHLHGAEVGAAGQKVGGKGVAEHVRTDILADSCRQGDFPDDLPEPVACHAGSPIGAEQQRAWLALEDYRSGPFDVGLHHFAGKGRERDDPFLVSFAEDAKVAIAQITAVHR